MPGRSERWGVWRSDPATPGRSERWGVCSEMSSAGGRGLTLPHFIRRGGPARPMTIGGPFRGPPFDYCRA